MPIPRYLANGLFSRTGRTRIAAPSSSKMSLSPGPTPKARRISRGTVICPLLVILACFFNAFLISLLYHTLPYICQITLPTRDETRVAFAVVGEGALALPPFGPAVRLTVRPALRVYSIAIHQAPHGVPPSESGAKLPCDSA